MLFFISLLFFFSDETNDELTSAELDSLHLENCVYDSFTKLKDIYDYQSSKYVNKNKSSLDTDDETESCPVERKVVEPDESFDRVKNLYDRASRSMLLGRQLTIDNSDRDICADVTNSNNNIVQQDSSVFV